MATSGTIDFGLGYDLTGLRTGGAAAKQIVARDMRGISTAMAGLSAGMSRLAPLIGGAAMLGGARSVVAFADEITDLSESIGMNVEQFQQWSFALEQNGARQTDLVKSMGAIIAKSEDALGGNEKTIASFAKLGITLDDLKSGAHDRHLLKMADALKRTGGDGATTAAMMDLLGNKLTLKMVPGLKEGSEAFLELGKSAHIASDQAIKDAAAFDDAWNKAMRGMKATTLNIGSRIGTFMKDSRAAVNAQLGITTPGTEARDPRLENLGSRIPDRAISQPPKPRATAASLFKNFRNPSLTGGLQGASLLGGGSGLSDLSPGIKVGSLNTLKGSGGLGAGAHGQIRKGDAARAKAAAAKNAEAPIVDAVKKVEEKMDRYWGKG